MSQYCHMLLLVMNSRGYYLDHKYIQMDERNTVNEKEEVDVLYSHAVGVFFQGVLHVSELWPETLYVLL